jgi:hypothetical protein
MFDRLAWRRECYERYLLLDDEEDELDDTEEAAAGLTRRIPHVSTTATRA